MHHNTAHPGGALAPLFQAPQRSAHADSLLRPDLSATLDAALGADLSLEQARSLLMQALDGLLRVPIDDADPQQAERFHEAFVQILHIAQTLDDTVEEAVLEQMANVLQAHCQQHDSLAHALVSAWTCVEPRDPAGLVLELVDALAADAAPLPFWLSHLLQLLPLSGSTRELPAAQGQVRALLQPRLDELMPERLEAGLQRLEKNLSLQGLQQIVGDLGLLALEQSPTAELSRFMETPPDDDESVVWFSHQHPGLVCVGNMPCDDHWMLSPLGLPALDRLLHLCTRLEAEPAQRLLRQLLYQFTHAARLPLLQPARRHPVLALAPLQRIAQALQAAGDADPWVDVLEWFAPHRSGHRAHPSNESAQHAVADLLLLSSFELQPLLALRTVLDAKIEPEVWLPSLVRCGLATQPGISRLLKPLLRMQASTQLHHQVAQAVLAQCPPSHRMRVGAEMGLTAFANPVKRKGLTRDGMNALALAQERFGAGWVPFGLLSQLLGEARRFGCGGMGVAEGEWLLAFAQENASTLPRDMPAPQLTAALENLYEVLTRLGMDAHALSQIWLHLFEQCLLTPTEA